MSSHFHFDTSSGWSSPADFCRTALILWHWKHRLTYSLISRSIPIHQYILFRSWYIFIIPGWIVHLDLCLSSIICYLRSKTSGTHILFQNLKTPSIILNSDFAAWLSRIFLSLGSSICLSLISSKIVGSATIATHGPSHELLLLVPILPFSSWVDLVVLLIEHLAFPWLSTQSVCDNAGLPRVILNVKVIVLHQFQPSSWSEI